MMFFIRTNERLELGYRPCTYITMDRSARSMGRSTGDGEEHGEELGWNEKERSLASAYHLQPKADPGLSLTDSQGCRHVNTL